MKNKWLWYTYPHSLEHFHLCHHEEQIEMVVHECRWVCFPLFSRRCDCFERFLGSSRGFALFDDRNKTLDKLLQDYTLLQNNMDQVHAWYFAIPQEYRETPSKRTSFIPGHGTWLKQQRLAIFHF